MEGLNSNKPTTGKIFPLDTEEQENLDQERSMYGNKALTFLTDPEKVNHK